MTTALSSTAPDSPQPALPPRAASLTQVIFRGDRLVVSFTADDFGSPAAYALFKAAKRLPEYAVELDADGLACGLSAPARFAPLLGVAVPPLPAERLPMSPCLFDDQVAITRMALDAKRFACWSDCGGGKTLIGWEFARQVSHLRPRADGSPGRVLIVTLNELTAEWARENRKFYGDPEEGEGLPFVVLESREQMKRWCATGEVHAERRELSRDVASSDDMHSLPPDMDRSAKGDGPATDGDRDADRLLVLRSPNEDVPRMGAGRFDQGRRQDRREPLELSEHPTGAGADRSEVLGVAAGRATAIAVVNYEKFNHRGEAEQVVSELRHLAGIVLDESSRLKTGGGKQKWALIKSARGIEFKLSLTATPAPNEIMEFASQASFLEKMRTDNEIIWTYFRRDEKTHRWTVKEHARKAFFEFMAGWSIYVRDPRKYGWRLDVERPPEPRHFVHTLPVTAEQRAMVMEFNADPRNVAEANVGGMFAGELNAIAANKLSQAAKGFVYTKGEADGDRDDDPKDLDSADARGGGTEADDRGSGSVGTVPSQVSGARVRRGDIQCRRNAGATAERALETENADRRATTAVRPVAATKKSTRRQVRTINSSKPGFVAELIQAEASDDGAGLCTLVWTVFDEESSILFRLLDGARAAGLAVELLTGKTKPAERTAILDRFESGQTRVLITRASLLGYGKNLQHVRSMIFSGWTFSYEQFYQAVRRSFRHGQRHRLRVHLPIVPELEGQMHDAIVRKQKQHEQAIAEMEANYIAARSTLAGGAASATKEHEGREESERAA